jgi:hypothetical protein
MAIHIHNIFFVAVFHLQVIHRLDHSIHTMRLYVATIAKKLCSDWNMKTFFKVVHNDMNLCLEQLNDLRLPGKEQPQD